MILIISRWHCQPALLSFSQLGLSWSKQVPVTWPERTVDFIANGNVSRERQVSYLLTINWAYRRCPNVTWSCDQNNTWSRTGCQSNQTRCSSSTPSTSSLPVHVSNWRFGLPWPLTLHRNRKDVAAGHVADLVTNLKRYSLNTMVSSQFFYTK